jgi:signal peptidase II
MKNIPYFILALGVFIADQLSKWSVTEFMIRPALGEEYGISRPFLLWLTSAPERLPFTEIPIWPFFNIVMVWNRGMSFGILNHQTDYGPLLLGLLAAVIIVIFTIWMIRSHSNFQCFGIALVIGGALGNILDRVRFGAVVDFLDFHINDLHWPAFNVSDSCICVGVILLIVQSFFFENPYKSAK